MRLINSDCIEAMKLMPDNSVNSIVTDPPYELGFMGKSWDASGIAFNVDVWREALRVIKPGGHLIAFSGSRTYHRMAVAIEDAGFEIRDQIMWVYGSGFPKSMSVPKAIEATLTTGNANKSQFKKLNGEKTKRRDANGLYSANEFHDNRPADYTESADGDFLTNLDPTTPEAKQWQGWGTALKPAHEPMVLARKPLIGTVANNVLTYGVGGLNIDGTRVEGKLEGDPNRFNKTDGETFVAELHESPIVRAEGRWPANFIHDGSDEVVALFPDAKGMATQKSGANINVYGGNALFKSKTTFPEVRQGFNDSGSAARFFYCAKASKRDRNEGLDGFEAKRDHDGRKDGGVGGDNPRNRTNNEKLNHHPTVKPTTLMQYIVRLVTPPNGTVLDPFMGSGSTGKACAYEGFDFIGIDQSAEYVAIAQARIDFAKQDN